MRNHRLFQFAEQVKISLAEQEDPEKPVDVRARSVIRDANGRDVFINERITRVEFEGMIRPLLDRTTDATMRALKKAGLTAGDIDEVLLVGGSTRGPWISEHLAKVVGGKPIRLFEPDLCIAAGAAIHASMVLPRLVVAHDIRIIIDCPIESPDDIIHISGSVSSERQVPASTLNVRLMSEAETVGETELDEAGRFFFEDVELKQEGLNKLRVVLADLDGAEEVSHEFTVSYNLQAVDASVINTVLPRPMSIETHEGLVTIADEGQKLPVRVERFFRRLNDNPSITLRLFQTGTCIGEVRVEDIPPMAGLDAQVELAVDITPSGRVIGHARIWDASCKKLLAQAPVAVEYRRQEVQSYAELMHAYAALRDELEERVRESAEIDGEEVAEELSDRGRRLVALIDHLTKLDPVDQMELQARLSELRQIVQPPPDVMQPSWKNFKLLWLECRRQVEAIEAAARQLIDSFEAGDGKAGLDRSMVTSSRERYGRALGQLGDLDGLHTQATDAHRMRDRPRWGKAYDALQRLIARVDENRDKQDAPTPIIKLLARRDAIRVLCDLHTTTARLEREGRVTDCLAEVRHIHQMLIDAIFEITEVDDGLDDEESREAVVEIFHNGVKPAESAIRKLGIDIGSAV